MGGGGSGISSEDWPYLFLLESSMAAALSPPLHREIWGERERERDNLIKRKERKEEKKEEERM